VLPSRKVVSMIRISSMFFSLIGGLCEALAHVDGFRQGPRLLMLS